MSGVTLTLKFKDDLYATTATDVNGNYSFSNVDEGGPYTIEPQKDGYNFAPPTQFFNNVDANKTANFNAVLILHNIAGQITADTGGALSGVNVTLSGSAASTVTTDQNGFYSFANLVPGGDYTVTPSKANYNFNPASATFNDLGKSETANFTGTGTVSPPASIQFELAGYAVSEGDHYTLIKVTRTGDASQPASVDYETQDITAGQRTDYTVLLGRLNFAPNETSKTLTLLVTEDSLIEGVETLNLILSNPAGAILGNQNPVQVIITDNDDDQNASNAIDETQNFVRQHYHDFLNREPEPGGFQGWQEILNKCAPGDTKCDRIEVSSAFYRSQEFHDRGYFIYRFYAASLGKLPKYLEFMRDMQKVSGFLSAEQQEMAKQAFIEEFMSRNEFKQKYDQLTDADSFVDAILSTAGVQLSQREQLISELQDGKRTRAETLRAIIESGEVDAKFYNESFVVMQYFGYLRRDPDILYLDWIKTLDQTGDYRIMVDGFLNSKEYRERFGH